MTMIGAVNVNPRRRMDVKYALNYFCAKDEVRCVAQNAWEGLSARQW